MNAPVPPWLIKRRGGAMERVGGVVLDGQVEVAQQEVDGLVALSRLPVADHRPEDADPARPAQQQFGDPQCDHGLAGIRLGHGYVNGVGHAWILS
ncbi:MAG: hypothetical protein R2851_27970 [Caldilineaceae bacterium]